MLDSRCLAAAARALRVGGALTVVTDNAWYADHLAALAEDVGGWATPDLAAAAPAAAGERYALRTTTRGGVKVFAGTPGPAVGHAPARPQAAGDSFFDRLWRRGVSQHASSKDRYVLHLVRDDAPVRGAPDDDPAPAPAPPPPEKKKRRIPTGGKYGAKKKKKQQQQQQKHRPAA